MLWTREPLSRSTVRQLARYQFQVATSFNSHTHEMCNSRVNSTCAFSEKSTEEEQTQLSIIEQCHQVSASHRLNPRHCWPKGMAKCLMQRRSWRQWWQIVPMERRGCQPSAPIKASVTATLTSIASVCNATFFCCCAAI